MEFFTTDEQMTQIYYSTQRDKGTEFFSLSDDCCLCVSVPLWSISILSICVIR